jgi:peptidoglycan/xylan/chitin deacetylase (PgdA/CDA1 family)
MKNKGAKLIVIWDYDTPLTRITATKPYDYKFEKCLQEEEDVKTILESVKDKDAPMTFAIVGYGAEPSVKPFDIRHMIRRIFEEGHEVASHSWKHEWFPYLTRYQMEKTLSRSKFVLEEIVGKGNITGFVPPHDRPYTWWSKFAFSLGDRALYPFHPGASIGAVADELVRQNYKWYRTTYRSLWNKLWNWKGEDYEFRLKRQWVDHKGLVCFQGTYNGFNKGAQELMKKAVETNATLVIVGHPAALSLPGAGNIDNYRSFMELAFRHKEDGKLKFFTVQQYIDTFIKR